MTLFLLIALCPPALADNGPAVGETAAPGDDALAAALREDPSLFPRARGAADGEAEEPSVPPTLSIEAGVTWVSAYWWRGYVYEDRGFIAQPYLDLTFPLLAAESEGDTSVEATVGTWHSFHSEATDATGEGWDKWYEADAYGGLTVRRGDVALRLAYTAYLYPSSSDIEDVQELGLTLAFSPDQEHWLGWLLGEPSVGVHAEIRHSNVGEGVDETAYLEFNFGPAIEVMGGKAVVSFPMAVGISLDDYYPDESGDEHTFGFFSAGMDVEVPVGSDQFGEWTLNFGVTGLVLGDATTEFNGGHDADLFGYAGLSWSY